MAVITITGSLTLPKMIKIIYIYFSSWKVMMLMWFVLNYNTSARIDLKKLVFKNVFLKRYKKIDDKT